MIVPVHIRMYKIYILSLCCLKHISNGTFSLATHAVRFLNQKRFAHLLYLPFSFIFYILSVLMLILALYTLGFLITPLVTLFFRQYEYVLSFALPMYTQSYPVLRSLDSPTNVSSLNRYTPYQWFKPIIESINIFTYVRLQYTLN